jgi:AhpD family alkylhydroperoxidase
MIPAPVRERLAIATAEYNNCSYGLSAHTFIGARVAKVDTGGLERARHADPHATAVLALPETIARGHIGERQRKAARAVGVTDAEIAEALGNLALNLLTDYFDVLADTDTEWPLVPRTQCLTDATWFGRGAPDRPDGQHHHRLDRLQALPGMRGRT